MLAETHYKDIQKIIGHINKGKKHERNHYVATIKPQEGAYPISVYLFDVMDYDNGTVKRTDLVFEHYSWFDQNPCRTLLERNYTGDIVDAFNEVCKYFPRCLVMWTASPDDATKYYATHSVQ